MKSRLSARMRGVAVAITAGVLIASGVSLAMPASAAPVGTLDQQSTVNSSGTWVYWNGPLAQTFTAGISGPLREVDLYLEKSATPTSVLVSIKAVDGAGLPTGSALASEVLNVTTLSTGVMSVVFTTPATMVAGTMYAIELSNCVNCDMSSDLAWRFGVSGYANGVGYRQGNVITLNGPADFYFQTYVTASTSASSSSVAPPPPPDISQSIGMPVSGNCNAIDDKSLNWGGAGSGNWTASWAAWANGGKGGAVCNRFLRYNANTTNWFSVSQ